MTTTLSKPTWCEFVLERHRFYVPLSLSLSLCACWNQQLLAAFYNLPAFTRHITPSVYECGAPHTIFYSILRRDISFHSTARRRPFCSGTATIFGYWEPLPSVQLLKPIVCTRGHNTHSVWLDRSHAARGSIHQIFIG